MTEFPLDVAQRVLNAGWTGDILILGQGPRHAWRYHGDGWAPVDLTTLKPSSVAVAGASGPISRQRSTHSDQGGPAPQLPCVAHTQEARRTSWSLWGTSEEPRIFVPENAAHPGDYRAAERPT